MQDIVSGGGISPQAAAHAGAYFTLLKAVLSTPAQLGVAQTLRGIEKAGASVAVRGAGQIGKILTQQIVKEATK